MERIGNYVEEHPESLPREVRRVSAGAGAVPVQRGSAHRGVLEMRFNAREVACNLPLPSDWLQHVCL